MNLTSKIRLMLSVLIVLIAMPVFAEWSRITFGNESSIYIDKSLIKRSGDRVMVWQISNFPLGTTSPDGRLTYKSSKTLESIDCKANKSKTIEFTWYADGMGQGKKIYSDFGHEYPWVYIQDGTLQAAVKKVVCQV